MMKLISRWFEPVYVSREYGRTQYALLWIILGIGAGLRFWNLGYAGLHGDEDIMALAARGVLEHGIPVLPSDMIYARAPLHTYIIAASMSLFGDSEWAIRFPSAVVGSLCGLFAFFLGKRFLEPTFNIMFVAAITFLPVMIEISQTARMYVFLIACLLVFGSLIFRWEKDSRPASLLMAMLVWLLALQFQPLAVFAAPLFFFPGIARGSWKLLLQGGAAVLIAYVAFSISGRLISGYYPDDEARPDREPEVVQPPIEILLADNGWLVIGIAVLIVLIVLAIGTIGTWRRTNVIPAAMLLAVGVIACASLQYHVGGIALLAGLVAWFRSGVGHYARLAGIAVLVALLAAVQVALLQDEFPGLRIIGALAGTPTLWPAVRFATFSPGAIAIFIPIAALMIVRFARGRPLPIHFLLFVMMVWAPLFAIGGLRALPAHRHLLGVLPFFLLCLFAAIQFVIRETRWGTRVQERPAILYAMCVGLLVAVTNPVAMIVEASNDFRTHPDHRGAAEFVKSLDLGPEDILIAEDSINQTYYLGKVDYRLQAEEVALGHGIMVDGRLRGMYTGTPFIVSGAELEALFDEPRSGQVFIIGSGQVGSRSRPRGDGIYQVLESDRLEVVYVGRDGKTMIWRLVH